MTTAFTSAPDVVSETGCPGTRPATEATGMTVPPGATAALAVVLRKLEALPLIRIGPAPGVWLAAMFVADAAARDLVKTLSTSYPHIPPLRFGRSARSFAGPPSASN